MSRTTKITKAPFLRSEFTVQSLMWDMLIVMPFLYIMPIFFYGFRVLKSLIISLTVSYWLDMLCIRFRDKKFNFGELSSLVTGAIIPLLLPASINAWIIVAADIIAILVAKHPFGGLGNTPFNCAAVGYCFAAISWSDKVFAFTKPMQWLNIFGSVESSANFVDTAAQNLANGGRPLLDPFDIISGNVAGAAGATCLIVILAAAIYLIFKHTITIQIPLGVLLGAAVFAFIFPRITTGRFESVWFELTSGVLIFGAVFMATEPSSSPKHPHAKWIYGALIGIITMLFRHFGKVEIAFPFALIIANSFTPLVDKIGTGIDTYTDIPSLIPKFLRKREDRKNEKE